MSKLIMIRGNSGSGKTTLATALQKKLGRNTLLISQDVVRRNMLWVNDGENTQCLPLLLTLLQYGRYNCQYVILEGILIASWYRSLFESAQELFGSDIYAYYYDLPFEETLSRHETKPNKMDFGESDMRRWWKERDYLGFLPEKTLSKELSLQDTIEMIYHDVTNKEADCHTSAAERSGSFNNPWLPWQPYRNFVNTGSHVSPQANIQRATARRSALSESE